MLDRHKSYMQRCFDLARMAGKYVKANPQVGAVIVHDDRIIGEGYHQVYGSAHAEVNAINSVAVHDRHLLTDATIYVSLEPCNHTGKTGPCTQAIIAASIPHVVISCLDPNPQMSGISVSLLMSHGIDVQVGICDKNGNILIRPFVANLESRPYIILKWAQSIDGYIGQQNKKMWLTSEPSSVLTHRWRSEVDGLLVGKNTVLVDDPSLTTRHWVGESPTRILLDTSLEIVSKAAWLSNDLPTIVINQVESRVDGNIQFIKVQNVRNVKEWLPILFDLGIYRLMVEGGGEVMKSFIDQNLWDEVRILTSPKVLYSGIAAPLMSLSSPISTPIGKDLLTIAYRHD
jgi:diaminohydroxyphosphoribosylaminopyrimidine deaminase / 5-amino-6-(5-phosphoribosylamino)uracil reductase